MKLQIDKCCEVKEDATGEKRDKIVTEPPECELTIWFVEICTVEKDKSRTLSELYKEYTNDNKT